MCHHRCEVHKNKEKRTTEQNINKLNAAHLEHNCNKKDARPLKSIGNPGNGVFSAAADIALVITFTDFAGPDWMLGKNGCLDEMWEELLRPLETATSLLAPKLAVHDMYVLREEVMEGLIAAMCEPGAAVVAIFDTDHQKPKQNSARLKSTFTHKQATYVLTTTLQ